MAVVPRAAPSTTGRSRTSPRMTSRSAPGPPTLGKFASDPVLKSSSTRTKKPSASRRAVRCEPIKPAPPVTRTRSLMPLPSLYGRHTAGSGEAAIAGPKAVEAAGAPHAPRVERVPEEHGEDAQAVDDGRPEARGRGLGKVAGRHADLGDPEPRGHHLRD